jgi:hypothetical protein
VGGKLRATNGRADATATRSRRGTMPMPSAWYARSNPHPIPVHVAPVNRAAARWLIRTIQPSCPPRRRCAVAIEITRGHAQPPTGERWSQSGVGVWGGQSERDVRIPRFKLPRSLRKIRSGPHCARSTPITVAVQVAQTAPLTSQHLQARGCSPPRTAKLSVIAVMRRRGFGVTAWDHA